MKIVTQRDELQQTIAVVQRAVSARTTLPILSNILFEAEDETLTLSATDLEIGVRAQLTVETERPGRTTLPARLLSEVVGAQSTGSPLVVEADEQEHVTFRCGKSLLQVNGLPADEFPVIPTIGTCQSVEIPQKVLKEMLQQCLIAVSNDETRARLTGMLVSVADGHLRLVATDTHRLATRSEPLPGSEGVELAAIIPGRVLREVERMLGDGAGATVTLEVSETQAQFRFDHVTVITRLIEGEFPNYRKVIPASHDWTVTVSAGALRESVRRCAIVSREDNRKMVVRTSPAGGLQLAAKSSKIGSADEELEDVTVVVADGVTETLEIAFNAEYMLQSLLQIDAEEITLELTAANQPGAIRPVADEDYVYVLMPMQLG